LGRGPRPFRFDRAWVFEVPPAELWEALSRTECYPQWWTGLHGFESDGLAEGARTRCTVSPPLPYSLRFTVTVDRVEPARRVDASVTGDLAGDAFLAIAPHPDGSQARMAWTVEVQSRILRAAAAVGRPVMQWGHEWVVNTGIDQFRRTALQEDPLP
jgi:uncharacterized protein YndB with AHSA1/START domain